MMHKLRLKFIRIATAALMAAVILVAAAINVMNWLNVRSEIGETVSFLAESDGMVSKKRADEWAGKNKHRNKYDNKKNGYSAPAILIQIRHNNPPFRFSIT